MIRSHSKNLLFLILLVVCSFSCGPSNPPTTSSSDSLTVLVKPLQEITDSSEPDQPDSVLTPVFHLPYNLNEPTEACKLPGRLEEISGLGYAGNGNLAIVEDEKGKIYLLDTHDCEVKEEWKFDKDGDYEGIEVVGDTAWVVRSDGMIYKVTDFTSKARNTQKFKTVLSEQNDVEGLGYLPATHQLLIACKAVPYLGKKQYKGKRAIYAFSLTQNRLETTPYLLIDLRRIVASREEDGFLRRSRELASIFDDGGDLNFQPSSIAIHPISGNMYILASVGKMLLVYNPQKQLIAMEPLTNKLFKQPEGMCFSPEGTLYISNEGRGGSGNVLIFNPNTHDQ